MAADASKRRRSEEDQGAAKRPALEGTRPDSARRKIRQFFEHYRALERGLESKADRAALYSTFETVIQGAGPFACPRARCKPLTSMRTYALAITAVCVSPALFTGASFATQRLATRIIPRFLHLFPHCVDTAAITLISAYQSRPAPGSEYAAMLAATKADALAGLCSVILVSQRLGEKAVQTALRVADFTIK